MKHLLILTLLLPYFVMNAQVTSDPVTFDDYTPLWHHSIVDSSLIANEEFNGTKHILESGRQFIIDSTFYIVYEELSGIAFGSLVFKIDTRTGKEYWQNKYSQTDTEGGEYTADAYIDENGLNIVSYKNLSPPSSMWDIDPSFQGAQLSKRIYNLETGEHTGWSKDSILSEEKLFFSFLFNVIRLNYVNGNEYWNYIPNKIDDEYSSIFKKYDENFDLIRIDTIEEIGGEYLCRGHRYFEKYDLDTYLYTRQDVACPENNTGFYTWHHDTTSYYIDFYDGEHNIKYTVDHTDDFYYKWTMGLFFPRGKKGYYSIISRDSVDVISNEYQALMCYDLAGNMLLDVDFGNEDVEIIGVAKLHHEPGFIYITQAEADDVHTIEIRKADEDGLDVLLQEIIINDTRSLHVSFIDLMEDGTILLKYTVNINDGFQTLEKHLGVFAVDGNSLGLISRVEDYVEENNLSFDIVPNPIKDHFRIELKENNLKPSSIKMYDVNGKLVLENKYVEQIEVSSLSPGVYYLRLLNDKMKVLGVKRLVKM